VQSSGGGPSADGAQGSSGGGEIRSLQDLPEYPRAFVVRRMFVFVGIVIGCAPSLLQ
jgi:hypothetical protein